jgi:membrane protein YdbS with pleckstrin-like domain
MDENIDHTPMVWQGQPAWSEYVFLWFFTAIATIRAAMAFWIQDRMETLIFCLGAVLFVALAAFLRQTTHYTVTRHAIYRTKGVWPRTQDVIPFETIASVDFEQGPVDRFFEIGSVILKLKDNGRRVRLHGVISPDVVYEKIGALL